MVDTKLSFIKEQDKRWAYEFFGKDEAWYDETMQKIEQIKTKLPDDISPNERTVRLYGWIEKNGKKNLSLPMMYDKDLPEFAHAIAVEYALTNPDVYNRAMSWD